MKKPTKTNAIKAKKYWKSASGSYLYPNKKSAQYFSGFQAPQVKPVAVMPIDAASVLAMVEQMARSVCENSVPWDHIGYGAQQIRLKMFRTALAAIGITKGKAK